LRRFLNLKNKPLRAKAFKAGIQTVFATIPGNFAWGFVVGLGMINLGLSVFQSSAFNVLVYSGSAQMVAMPLMAAGVSLSLVFFATFMACIRFVLYSAAMAPALHHLPLPKRLFVSALSIDAAIGLFLARRAQSIRGEQTFPHRITFLLGMNLLIWSAWSSGVFAGIFAAGALPTSAKFSYLGIVALLGITVAMMRSKASVACAIASALVATLTQEWPYKLGLLCAILIGIAVGYSLEQKTQPVAGAAT
jgi:predicted branched-subunit amino acid permease